MLHKRRWTAGPVFLVIVLAVTFYTFTVTPVYEASTQLLIESDNPNVVSFQEVLEQERTSDDYYQTQYGILKSRIVARKTLETLALWEHPEFGGEPDDDTFSLRRTVGDAADELVAFVAGIISFTSAAGNAPAPNETDAQSRAVDILINDKLTVAPVRNSRLVNVSVRSPDPVLAEAVTNTLARIYIEQNLEFSYLASREATDWLGERLAEQRASVEASEVVLQQYREQHDAVALEDRQNIVVQRLAELNAVVTRAKTQRLGSSHECMQGEQVLSAFKLCRISHLRESAMTRYLRRGCGGLDRRLHLRARGTRPPAFEAVEGSSGRAMAIGASQPRVSPGCMIVTA